MEEIEKWLDNTADYEAGKALYNIYAPRYRKDEVLALQINSSSNSFSKEILKEELREIVKLIAFAKSPEKAQSMMFHKRGDIDGLPEDLKALDDLIPTLYKNRDFHRYRARDMQSGPTLRNEIFLAVKLDLRIREIYSILDYYKRTGMYPPGYVTDGENSEESKIEIMTAWLIAQKRYPSQISRMKDNPDHAEEVAEMRKVMAEINEFIKHATE